MEPVTIVIGWPAFFAILTLLVLFVIALIIGLSVWSFLRELGRQLRSG